MIHFLFLLLFSLVIGVAFGIFAPGDARQKLLHGLKIFAQFAGVGFALGWICYFLPL